MQTARDFFRARFHSEPDHLLSIPGRINLIGEHIDYHDLPVLPIAIQRRIQLAFRSNPSRCARIESESYEARQLSLDAAALVKCPPGDWGNYVRAGVQIAASRWPISQGIDAAITSDLPAAAGLSSSSALLIGLTLALLSVNEVEINFDQLMDVFPEGEQLVGTRGGGMDHAAILGSRAGSALLIRFAPLQTAHVPIPADWAFLAAHSMTTAEKSGAARLEYNSRREAGAHALEKTGFPSFRAALARYSAPELTELARKALLSEIELGSFLHVISEAQRVEEAEEAMVRGDETTFGRLLYASHLSLRDQLCVSNNAMDELVECAMESGAMGARLTGAGFGGYVIILCSMADRDRVRAELIQRFYSSRAGFKPEVHLFFAEPSAGVLCG
jgi:galactokinase